MHSGDYQMDGPPDLTVGCILTPSNTQFIGIGPRITWRMLNGIGLAMETGNYQFENVNFVTTSVEVSDGAQLTL